VTFVYLFVFSSILCVVRMRVTFVYLFVFSSILCVVRMRSRGLMIPIILHILNNAWVVFGLLFSATE
ncbi:CPBP family glutamic-type intramembrane protease, partial [Salmonella enterica]|uniref:CPBP family glutamic-type intramembrane protease n=1 Tax=Salmonella enterica TaxID=28901 RepID=UPI0026DC9709